MNKLFYWGSMFLAGSVIATFIIALTILVLSMLFGLGTYVSPLHQAILGVIVGAVSLVITFYSTRPR